MPDASEFESNPARRLQRATMEHHGAREIELLVYKGTNAALLADNDALKAREASLRSENTSLSSEVASLRSRIAELEAITSYLGSPA